MRNLRRARVLALVVALLLGASRVGAGAPRFGLEVGLTRSRLTFEPSTAAGFSPSYQSSWLAGGTVSFPLSAPFALESGLRYRELPEQSEFELLDPSGMPLASGDIHTLVRSISVPIRVEARPFASRRLSFAAGPEVSWLFDAKRTVTGWPPAMPASRARPTAIIFEGVGTLDHDVSDDYGPLDVALSVGVGFELPAGAHAASMHLRYAHGLLDAFRPDQITRRTRLFEWTLGWLW